MAMKFAPGLCSGKSIGGGWVGGNQAMKAHFCNVIVSTVFISGNDKLLDDSLGSAVAGVLCRRRI